MRVRPPALALLLTASWCLASAAAAQQPWIDAGQQAMIQHYNNLIEQQSAPDQEDAVEEVRRRPEPAEDVADERCDPETVRARLRPEYERRLQSGLASRPPRPSVPRRSSGRMTMRTYVPFTPTASGGGRRGSVS